eukprot:CAMPEP_0181174606 /NCGR_PEP_ID=MMETSP1096-20121128/3633_1 /TAXON_ID=156174 ORGANISM="Chrysochromulina ericina, Strain CCMP281" /NCGR_SAMPLE_ID=MMETSP1096 /ASSEMBLY_ACC=CAM_ASM_000453 /LENGTH=156 /DNA_ID=CAMNT_0023262533 /DNA_START=154 /DNA_END=625 /DNA_ORIENTATION=-
MISIRITCRSYGGRALQPWKRPEKRLQLSFLRLLCQLIRAEARVVFEIGVIPPIFLLLRRSLQAIAIEVNHRHGRTAKDVPRRTDRQLIKVTREGARLCKTFSVAGVVICAPEVEHHRALEAIDETQAVDQRIGVQQSSLRIGARALAQNAWVLGQ